MMGSRLAELPRQECLALLAAAQVGRVVYTDGALPMCTPVNYVVYRNAIIFRTSPGARILSAVEDTVVAFEVDDFDVVKRTGWSVLATGTATAVRDVSTLLRLERTGLVAWAGGERSCWVRIVPTLLTGRRVLGAVGAMIA